MQLTFDEFVIDTTSFELRRGDQVCPVEPLVFDLVHYLARNSQRLVSRDELIEHVWSGRIVSDATISSCIKAARQALGDSGNEQRLIRTVRSRGLLAAQSQPDRDAIYAAVDEGMQAFQQDGAYRVPMPALIGSAVRPGN